MSFNNLDQATRGIVSMLAWNTLNSKVWEAVEYTSDGVEIEPTGKTLLETKFKGSK